MVELLRGCPKCQGTMKGWQDSFGVYLMCRHCGYLKDLEGKEAKWLRKQLRRESRELGQRV